MKYVVVRVRCKHRVRAVGYKPFQKCFILSVVFRGLSGSVLHCQQAKWVLRPRAALAKNNAGGCVGVGMLLRLDETQSRNSSLTNS